MNKPKYNTSKEATDALNKIIRHLKPMLKRPIADFAYEREWDEMERFIGDFLCAFYRGGAWYRTTMSPEKFEKMSSEAQADFLNHLSGIQSQNH